MSSAATNSNQFVSALTSVANPAAYLPPADRPASSGVGSTLTGMITNLSKALESAIHEIQSVNSQTKILALNARIEAARAGSFGAAFSVVAEEMQNLSDMTTSVADAMASKTRAQTRQLLDTIGVSVRGTRLSDLALVNIDLIDRNLYERTCDVRWWATDPSLVEALKTGDASAIQYASSRMGVILGAYTVYYDLVLTDTRGRVLTNGKPHQFSSCGQDASHTQWFTSAMRTRSGDEFGFQSAHTSPLAANAPVLVYSCGVRDERQNLLGVLGIVFNWEGLAGPIVREIPVDKAELDKTQAYIVTSEGRILASNQSVHLNDQLTFPGFERILSEKKGFLVEDFGGRKCCIGHARSPGFETYSTGWYSLVIQPIDL